MQEPVTGELHGRTITLDREVRDLEGRVRVVIEPVVEAPLSDEVGATIAKDEQERLWREWVAHGPHGPLVDENDDEFP